MRVPNGSGEGQAKVKVSFPGLTTLKVAEGTFTIEVKKGEAAPVLEPSPGSSCGGGK